MSWVGGYPNGYYFVQEQTGMSWVGGYSNRLKIVREKQEWVCQVKFAGYIFKDKRESHARTNMSWRVQ